MNELDLARAAQVDDAATPAPWARYRNGFDEQAVGPSFGGDDIATFEYNDGDPDFDDAEFVVYARNHWAALVAAASRATELQAERDELLTKLNRRIEDAIDEGLGLKSVAIEGGGVEMTLATDGAADHVVLAFVDGLAEMLGDATNYVEMSVRRRHRYPLTVRVSRYGRPTPHELRERAEKERDEALAALARVREAVQACHAHRFDLDPEHVGVGHDEKRAGGPDIFYNGIEFARKRIERAINGPST